MKKENFYFSRGAFKATDCVREQGAGRSKSAAYIFKKVCEHFEEVCNAAIGR
jgi:hypothetical protein